MNGIAFERTIHRSHLIVKLFLKMKNPGASSWVSKIAL
jgi:hypothetical protein